MYHITKREIISIGVAVFAVIFACFYMLVYEPKKKEAFRLKEEIKTVNTEIERIQRAIPGLGKLEEDIKKEQKRLSMVKETMSGRQQVKKLLKQLAREAYRLNIDVISLEFEEEPEQVQEKLHYRRLTIVMRIQCPYRHLSSYLTGLRDLSGLISVGRLEITKNNQAFPWIQAELTLGTFISLMQG